MGRSMGTVKTSYSQHELDELAASARMADGSLRVHAGL